MLEHTHLPWGGDQYGVRFATTDWKVLESATQGNHDAQASMYRMYARPLYNYFRWRHCAEGDAEDLVQSFFAHLFQSQALAKLSASNGRLRTYLMLSADNLLNDEFKKKTALKRGGGQAPISWDSLKAEHGDFFEPIDHHTPEENFDRLCAAALVHQAWLRLKKEIEPENTELFEVLKNLVSEGHGDDTYGKVAFQFKTSEEAIKKRVHRIRKRLGEIMKEEISRTVGPAQVLDELRYLLEALKRR